MESTPGAGTVFTVDLPALDLPASLEDPPRQPPAPASMQTGTGRLLVMDDDEALRVLFKAVLTSLGYDVQAAADGAEAVALYETAKATDKAFDAVILDLTVTGGMGGLEAADKLKELDPVLKADRLQRLFRRPGYVSLCRVRLRGCDRETLDGERDQRGSSPGVGCRSRAQRLTITGGHFCYH